MHARVCAAMCVYLRCEGFKERSTENLCLFTPTTTAWMCIPTYNVIVMMSVTSDDDRGAAAIVTVTVTVSTSVTMSVIAAVRQDRHKGRQGGEQKNRQTCSHAG